MKRSSNRSVATRLRALFVAVGLVLAGVVGVASPASAATGNILPPFNTGETWYVLQGYGPNAPTHNNNDPSIASLYGLDLTYGNSTTASAGRTVRAPMSGTVSYYQASYGNLCVNTADGGSYTLTHISGSVTSGSVTAGQAVGTVGAAGSYNNNGVAHIHFQTWSTSGCWANTDGGMPFDSTNARRICGAPDFTATGPSGGNGAWSGTSFTGQNCGGSSSSSRGDLTGGGSADLLGISRGGDGTPYVNEFTSQDGSFSAPSVWAHPTTGWSSWDTKVWLTGSVGTDNKADLIGISKAGDGTPYIYVFPSRGDEFGAPVLWAHPTTGWSSWDTKVWLMGDATGDNKDDLIGISKAGDGTPYVYVFESTGSSFKAPVLWAHPTTGWTDWDNKVWLVDDFGGDGKADLLGISRAGDDTPYIYVFPSRGDEFGDPALWAHPTTGWTDWDNKVWLSGSVGTDNKADLIGISKAGDGTPYVNVFPSRGDEFGDPSVWAHPTDGWTDWAGKVWLVNDYGIDGKADLIGISRGGDGTPWIYVFPSRGDEFGDPALWAHPTTGWTDWDNKVWR